MGLGSNDDFAKFSFLFFTRLGVKNDATLKLHFSAVIDHLKVN